MFWDSSALVPILLPESRSEALIGLLAADREVVIWWATPLECQSALYRRHRDAPLPSPVMRDVADRLRAFVEHADTIAPTDEVRRRAARLLASHVLRAADALQLAAALVWCEEQPHNETFVSLDERLCAAARKEGFAVAPESSIR
ncbi:MAG: type II toxin-antitoxin system VapC family toxin [Acidobacteriota bacterium]